MAAQASTLFAPHSFSGGAMDLSLRTAPLAEPPFALHFFKGAKPTHQDLRAVARSRAAAHAHVAQLEPALSPRGASPPRVMVKQPGVLQTLRLPAPTTPRRALSPRQGAPAVGNGPHALVTGATSVATPRSPFRPTSPSVVYGADLRAFSASECADTEQLHRQSMHIARIKAVRATTPRSIREGLLGVLDCGGGGAWAGGGAGGGSGGDDDDSTPRPTVSESATLPHHKASLQRQRTLGSARSAHHWDAIATLAAPIASAAVVADPGGSLARALTPRAAQHASTRTGADTLYSAAGLRSADRAAALWAPPEDLLPLECRAGPDVAAAVAADSVRRLQDMPLASFGLTAGLGPSLATLRPASRSGWAPSAGSAAAAASAPSSAGDGSGSGMVGANVDLRDGHAAAALARKERAAGAAAAQRALLESRGLPVSQAFALAAEPHLGGEDAVAAAAARLSVSRELHPSLSRARAITPVLSALLPNSPRAQGGGVEGPRRHDEYGLLTRTADGLPPAWVFHTSAAESGAHLALPAGQVPLYKDSGKFSGGSRSPRAGSRGMEASQSLTCLSHEVIGGGGGEGGGAGKGGAGLQHPHVAVRVWTAPPEFHPPNAIGNSSGVAALQAQPTAAALVLDDAVFMKRAIGGSFPIPLLSQGALRRGDSKGGTAPAVDAALGETGFVHLAASRTAAREAATALAERGGFDGAMHLTDDAKVQSGAAEFEEGGERGLRIFLPGEDRPQEGSVFLGSSGWGRGSVNGGALGSSRGGGAGPLKQRTPIVLVSPAALVQQRQQQYGASSPLHSPSATPRALAASAILPSRQQQLPPLSLTVAIPTAASATASRPSPLHTPRSRYESLCSTPLKDRAPPPCSAACKCCRTNPSSRFPAKSPHAAHNAPCFRSRRSRLEGASRPPCLLYRARHLEFSRCAVCKCTFAGSLYGCFVEACAGARKVRGAGASAYSRLLMLPRWSRQRWRNGTPWRASCGCRVCLPPCASQPNGIYASF